MWILEVLSFLTNNNELWINELNLHFNIPRIWLRNEDKNAVQQNEKISNTNKNINELLLTTTLKLLQIYFIINDANKLLKIIQKYIDNNNQIQITDSEINNENINILENNVFFQTQKRLRLNPQLISYFECGLFGSALIPKQLLHLELLNIELKSQYKQCIKLFTQQFYKYLTKYESKIIQLFSLSHSQINLIEKEYKYTFKNTIELQLKSYNNQLQTSAIITTNNSMENNIKINKYSQIYTLNNENVMEYKLDQTKFDMHYIII